jgi:hypothetical protein
VALFGVAVPAQAGPLSGSNIIIMDGATTLVEGTDYAVTAGGVSGNWTLSVTSLTTTGNFTFTALLNASNQPGTPLFARIATSQFDVTDIATDGLAHTLSVTFSDRQFSSPLGSPVRVTNTGSASFTGVSTAGGATLQSFADNTATDPLFGTASGTSGISGAVSTGLVLNSHGFTPDPTNFEFARINTDFSLTSQVIVTLANTGATVGISTSTMATTPEPGTMTLLGIGLVGMASYGWRRRRQNAGNEEAAAVVA